MIMRPAAAKAMHRGIGSLCADGASFVQPYSARSTRGQMDTPRLEIMGEKWRITAATWLATLRLAPSQKSWF